MTAPRTYGRLACPECGQEFARTHARQSFCTNAHKRAFHDRTKARGQVVVTLLQAWRAGRNVKTAETAERKLKGAAAKDAFNQLCTITDRWSEEDRDAGRVPALDLVIRQSALGFRDPLTA